LESTGNRFIIIIVRIIASVEVVVAFVNSKFENSSENIKIQIKPKLYFIAFFIRFQSVLEVIICQFCSTTEIQFYG